MLSFRVYGLPWLFCFLSANLLCQIVYSLQLPENRGFRGSDGSNWSRSPHQMDPPIESVPGEARASPAMIYQDYKRHRNGLMCHDREDGTQRLFETFMAGLPPISSSCPQRRVLIVGGGVSGLTAAKMLKEAGHHVLVLEASNQIGGRVQTYRDLQEGWHVELGAMRIPNHATFLLEFLKMKGIQLAPFRSPAGDENVYIHHRSGHGQQIESLDEEGERYTRIYEQAMARPKRAFRHLPWKTFTTIYDRFSLKQWLRRSANISHEDIEKMAVHFNFEGVANLGLVETVLDECAFSNPEFQTLPNGMDEIPRTMAEDLEGYIRLNAKVVGIAQEQDHVTIKVDCHGTNCEERDRYFADAVIVTTGPAVTTTIQFKPPLPRRKAGALRKANYQLSTKVVLVFHSPFWEREGGPSGRKTYTDLIPRVVYYPTHKTKSGVGVLLASYTWGKDSLRLIGMSDEDVIEKCLEALAEMHHKELAFVKEELLRGVVKHWSLDPFTLGAFAQFAPFEYSELDEYLKRPVGRIFFGGEYTESPHGWIDTAMKSGVRAVAQLVFGPYWKTQSTCLNFSQ